MIYGLASRLPRLPFAVRGLGGAKEEGSGENGDEGWGRGTHPVPNVYTGCLPGVRCCAGGTQPWGRAGPEGGTAALRRVAAPPSAGAVAVMAVERERELCFYRQLPKVVRGGGRRSPARSLGGRALPAPWAAFAGRARAPAAAGGCGPSRCRRARAGRGTEALAAHWGWRRRRRARTDRQPDSQPDSCCSSVSVERSLFSRASSPL